MSRNLQDKKPTAPKKQRFNDVVFVNWSLTDEQKAACKAWLVVDGDVDNALLTVIEEGYKITCSYDSFRSCFTASLVPQNDSSPNKGFILTGKGSTPLKAAKQCLYIHYHIMDTEWAAYSSQRDSEEMDD